MRLIKVWVLALPLVACGGNTSRTSAGGGGSESGAGTTGGTGTKTDDSDGEGDGDQASTPVPVTGAYLTLDFADDAVLGADDVKLHAAALVDGNPFPLNGFDVTASVVDGTGAEIEKVTVDLASATADFTVARGALETASLKFDIASSSGLALADDKISFSRKLAQFGGSAATNLQEVRLLATAGITRTLTAASYCDSTGYLPAPRVDVAGVATPVATWSPEESADFQGSNLCFAKILTVVGTVKGSLLAPSDVLGQRLAGGPDTSGEPRCVIGLLKATDSGVESLIVVANDATDTYAKVVATAFQNRCTN